MSNIAVKADIRNADEQKKNASRRLRCSGFIPAVVYGLDQQPVEIKLETKEFKDIIKGRSLANLILDLHFKYDGKEKKETTLIKEIQKNPITTDILHVDFIRIQMKKEVEATVPVHITNEEESVGVKEEGGVVQHGLREIHVLCLPGDIPEKIEYDIKDLHMGVNIKVADISLGENIKILSSPEEIIVSIIHATHAIIEQPEETEGAEAEPEVISKGKESAGQAKED
jgi:large subunit ribosomal protein L25